MKIHVPIKEVVDHSVKVKILYPELLQYRMLCNFPMWWSNLV